MTTTFHIEQFGCRATQADGAAIERQLLDQGCGLAADPSSADVVVLNTCTVTASADTQARDAIRKIHAANPATRIIVTGCYAQRAPEEIAALPGVTFVVGNSHKPQIPALLQTISHAPLRDAFPIMHSSNPAEKILIGDIFQLKDVLVAPVLGGEGHHTRPTVKIQDGCNARCSFCVIPSVRGKSRSLSPETVLGEVHRLSDSGYREIVFSGINLGTYGRDLSPRVEFLGLLRRVLNETLAATDRIAPHFHMPLQSASNRILAAMHRWYRAEHYARRIELIRETLPHAAIGADVITGFPGETDADHAATMDFIRAHPFTYLHVFSYSARPGTKAAALPGHLPGHVVKQRARALRALGEQKAESFRASQLGRTLRVLTLRRDANSLLDETPALSANYLSVRLPGALPPNQFLYVIPDRSNGKHLSANTLESSLAQAAS